MFRCLLCGRSCYPEKEIGGETDGMVESLLESGKFKERFLMKRKTKVTKKDNVSLLEFEDQKKEKAVSKEETEEKDERIFLMDDGKLKLFSPEKFTSSILYQGQESFEIERKLVRPKEEQNVIFVGRKPSKNTVPIVVTKENEYVLLESWGDLDSNPEYLTEAKEVIGVSQVRQVFVLRRK